MTADNDNDPPAPKTPTERLMALIAQSFRKGWDKGYDVGFRRGVEATVEHFAQMAKQNKEPDDE